MLPFVEPLWEIDDEDEEDQESSSYSSDSDYEAMFSNAPIVKISLADLQRLSEESQQTFEPAAACSLRPEEESQAKAGQRLPKKGTTPEQILASLLDDLRKDELKERKTTKKTSLEMTLPPFRGTRALREEEEGRGEGNKKENKMEKLDPDVPQLHQRTTDETPSRQRSVERGEVGESSREGEEQTASGAWKPVPDTPGDGAVPAREPVSARDPGKVAPSASSSEEEEEEDQGQKQTSSQLLFKPKEDVQQQRKDNIRRLAAIQQRQKEAEEHKKVIQGALAKLVSCKPRKISVYTRILWFKSEDSS